MIDDSINVPQFRIRDADGVAEYLQGAAGRFYERLGVSLSDRRRLNALFVECLQDVTPNFLSTQDAGRVDAVPSARMLSSALGDILVAQDSEMCDEEHWMSAKRYLEDGGNILLIHNHRSGADTLIMETLMERKFGSRETENWGYMSGHAVNMYLLPVLFSSGVRRFQIISAKYRAAEVSGDATVPMQAIDMTERQMLMQNVRAIHSMGEFCREGGKVVVLFPEGGRGENGLKKGEARTMKIPEVMSEYSPEGFKILPVYISGATNILPVARGSNEYNELIERINVGRGVVKFGPMVDWDPIAKFASETSDARMRLLELLGRDDVLQSTNERFISREITVDALMILLARLAPGNDYLGEYGNAELQAAVEQILSS